MAFLQQSGHAHAGLADGARCLKADICQLGMDQRKVNMLAREYCDDIKRKLKPVILSHAMLPGLKQVGAVRLTSAAALPLLGVDG